MSTIEETPTPEAEATGTKRLLKRRPGLVKAAEPDSRYAQSIDVDSNSTHARLVRLVGFDKRVLELGCSSGYMSAVLKSRGCQVVGIEIEVAAARLARRHCKRVIVADLDQVDFKKVLGSQRFDVILAGDVLEHLKDPARALSELSSFLAPHGYFVVSVPNIAHASVRLSLLRGNFDYTETGLLDRSHLRFFTLLTIQSLLQESGFLIGHLERVEMDLSAGEIPIDRAAFSSEVLDSVESEPEAKTYQFVFTAVPVLAEVRSVVQRRFSEASEQVESAEHLSRARVPHQQRTVEQLQNVVTTQADRVGQLERKLADRDLLVDQLQSSAESTSASFRILETALRERTAQLQQVELDFAAEFDRVKTQVALKVDQVRNGLAAEVQSLNAELARIAVVQQENFSQVTDRDWTIASLRTVLATRDRAVADLQGSVSELDRRIAEMDSEAAARGLGFEAEIAERDRLNAELNEGLTERDLTVGALTEAIRELDSRNALLQRDLLEREQQALSLNEEIARQVRILNEQLAQQAADSEDEIARRGRRVAMLESELAERDRVTTALNSEVELRHRQISHLEAHSAQQADGIEWLRGEVRLRDFKLEKIYRSRLWRSAGWYWRVRGFADIRARKVSRVARDLAVQMAGRLLPRRAKTEIKKFWNPRSAVIGSKPPVANLAAPGQADPPALASSPAATYDVICFSIIDWAFRWQRPQQIMSQFARENHRVFFLKTTEFLPAGASRSFESVAVRENVWEITLRLPRPLDVYGGVISDDTADWLVGALADMRRELSIDWAVAVVQVPTWTRSALEARKAFGWKVVYDCMDEWNSFPGMKPEMLLEERRLVSDADLVCVSAERLRQKWEGHSRRLVLAKNAADFDHFATAEPNELLRGLHAPIIGYFGAIAEWFDIDLMVRVAKERPDYSFVLIGGVFNVSIGPLSDLPNVRILGQQPYSLMPLFLANFNACIIPFVVNEITAATDPVKFYEYFSQGKPVVTTEFPELFPYQDLFYMAKDGDDFLQKLDDAVRESEDRLGTRRIELARENTWASRVASIKEGIRAAHQTVSIVVVTWNNVELTRLCLESVRSNTSWPKLEIIVVDNDSRDETRAYLESLRSQNPNVRLIFNDHNAGFAVANNQGLAIATGDLLILLNNDTVVPRGWMPPLIRHLEKNEVGLVVAATNFSGNESRIDVPYTTLPEMHQFASQYMLEHEGECFDIAVAPMYCVAMRRDVYARIGPLDEQFVVGMFEDDDYSQRVRMEGLRVVCAEDAFVHHFGQASFGKLSTAEYQAIWDLNQERFEKKWGTRWQPHTPRHAAPTG